MILSRHRLPAPFRGLLVGLWLAPLVLMGGSLMVVHGVSAVISAPPLWLALIVMGLPAVYVWHEGIDVTEAGIQVRMQGWRYRDYQALAAWALVQERDERILTVWDVHHEPIVNCHAGHLTDLPKLVNALRERVKAQSL